MRRLQTGRAFVSSKTRRILLGSGLILAVFLMVFTAGASPSEDITLSVSFRGLKLNALMQWQTVPLGGTFEVLAGETALGQITANRTMEQQKAGLAEMLTVSRQDAQRGISLRPITAGMPTAFVCQQTIPVAWNGESSLRADVLAYAREGLFRLVNTLVDNGGPAGMAGFEVLDSSGQSVLSFTTDNEGRFSASAPLPEGSYVLRQTLSPEGTLPAENVSFDIVPYLGSEESMALLAVQNAPVPVLNRLKGAMDVKAVPAGDLYAADQTVEFRLFSQTGEGNTLPLENYTVDIGSLVLLDCEGNAHPDQSGKEISGLAVTPDTEGIQAKAWIFDAQGQSIGGERRLAPGQTLSLKGQKAVSVKIVYTAADGQPVVPEGFELGEISLQIGLARRTPQADKASVEKAGVTVKQAWQYQYPGRDGNPVIASGENGSIELRARVFDSRAVLRVSALANDQGRIALTVRHEGGPALESPRLAVKLPDGWRMTDSFAQPVVAVSHGDRADIAVLALSGTLSKGQEQTVEFAASFGAGHGEGAVWIESTKGGVPTLDNPLGSLVWGEREEGCLVADAAFGLSTPGTYAYSIWTAENKSGAVLTLQPLGYPGSNGEPTLPANGEALLLLAAGDAGQAWYQIILPQGIKLREKPLGQVSVTTDTTPQPSSVWLDVNAFSGDWSQVTGVSVQNGQTAWLPVRVDSRPGSVQVATLSRTAHAGGKGASFADAVDAEGSLSIAVGRQAALSGRMFDDVSSNGRQEDGEAGAAGQLVLWQGPAGIGYHGYTDAGGAFDFSGAASDGQTGKLYAQLPENTAIAGERGAGGLYLAAQTILNQKTDVQIAFSRMCALYGRVYEQEGQDGIAGAKAELISGGQTVKSLLTDAQGQYRFEGLTPGEYQVALMLPDTLSDMAGFYSGDGYAQASGAAALLPSIILQYGGETGQNGPVRRYGSLSVIPQGYIYPLGNASLHRDGNPVAELTAADDGSYVFGGLFSGAYTLDLNVPQGLAVRAEGMASWQKGFLSLDADVPAGGEKRFALDVTVTGVLTLQFNGAGLGDSPVELSGPEARQGVLDANGSCVFTDLIPGVYTVKALLPQTVLKDQSGVWQVEAVQEKAASSLTVEVLPGLETVPQAAVLLQAASIEGTIFEDTQQDGMLGTGEAALPGARVELFHEQDGTFALVQTAQTGDDGLYRFASLVPGQYRLSIALPEGKALANQQAEQPFLLESGQKALINAATVSPAMMKANAFWDSNNDGLQGIYERAIEGTLVEVLPAEGESDTVVAQGMTNRDGQISFDGIAPGSYRIRFTLPEGYWFSQKSDSLDLKRNAVPMADSRQGTTEPFILPEGQTTGLGVGGIKTGTISGRIWLDANEDGVMNDDEAGLAGCQIALTGSRDGQHYAVTTDDTGLYAITARTDNYVFSVQGPEGMSFTRGSSTGGTSRSIITTEGAAAAERKYVFESGTREENQNIGFVPGAIVEGMAFLDDNYNGVFDSGEQAVSGVSLELMKANNAKALGSAITGEDGTFRFGSLRGGDYSLRAVLPDTGVVFTRVPSDNTDYKNLFTHHAGKRETDATLTLNSGERRAVGVGSVIPGSLSGGVFADDNYNGQYDVGEPPVSGALVRLFDQDGEMAASMETDNSGQFAFGGLMPMVYTLAVEKPSGYMFTLQGEGGSRSRIQAVDKNEGVSETVAVALGEQVSGVYAGVILPAGVQGQVFADANDDGLLSQGEGGFEGALVSLLNESGQTVQSIATGADGLFAFADLHPGRYELTYQLPEDAVYAAKATGGNEIAGEALFASGEAFELKIGEARLAPLCGAVSLGRISGTAIHDENANGMAEEGENPLSGVHLTLTSQRTGQEAGNVTTGADGAFILDRLRPGVYTLDISLPSGMVFARKGADALMNPVLEPHGSLQLEIRMGDRLDGRLVGGVLPASVTGHVWMDENNNGREEPEEARLGGLELQVLDTLTGNVFATLLTDDNGMYAIPAIQPGTYDFTLSLPGNSIAADMAAGENLFHDTASGVVALPGLTLREGEELTDIRAGVRKYISIMGTAWADMQGTISPQSGVQVSLYEAGDLQTPLKSVMTGEDGAYRFDQLMPGEYCIGAVLPQGYLFVKPHDERLQSGQAASIIADTAAGCGEAFPLYMGGDQARMDIGAVSTGKLGDYVWLDENKNGLQDSGEPGIPGLTVVLMQDGQQAAAVLTDAYGYYLFDGAYPMTSQVRVTMYPELVPTQQRTDFPLLVSALMGHEGDIAYTGDVMVTSGGRNFDCDLGLALKDGSKRPDAIKPPPAQNWE